MTVANHNFNFEGGEILRTIGATWLVSYAYYDHVDKAHTNWNGVKTTSQRISRYERSREHHTDWLRHVESINDTNLAKNTIGLNPEQVKKMAHEVLGAID